MTRTLILALPGSLQTIERNAIGGSSDYWNFTKMSGLNNLAYADHTGEVLVHFLQPRWRMWLPLPLIGESQQESIEAAIEYFHPDRVIGCGFSSGATELLHVAQEIDFDGLVLASGVRPPFFDANRIWGKMDVMIWVGATEPEVNAWWRPFVSTHEESMLLANDLLAAGHYVTRQVHYQGHTWPRHLTGLLINRFNLPYAELSR